VTVQIDAMDMDSGDLAALHASIDVAATPEQG
jgi:hypothetical protein